MGNRRSEHRRIAGLGPPKAAWSGVDCQGPGRASASLLASRRLPDEVAQATGDEPSRRLRTHIAQLVVELGPLHVTVLAAELELAGELQAAGRCAEAEVLLWRSVRGRAAALGVGHPDVRRPLRAFARLLPERRSSAGGEEAWLEGLGGDGEAPEDTLRQLNDGALALKVAGDLAEAEALYRRALAVSEVLNGPDHRASLAVASNLASLLQARGEAAAADRLWRWLWRCRGESLGPRHPDTLRTAHCLGASLLLRGSCAAVPGDLDEGTLPRLVEAESLLRQAAEGREAALGESHEETLRSAAALAATLQRRAQLAAAGGQLDVAEPAFQEALGLLRRVWLCRGEALGPQHPETAAALRDLGLLMHLRGDFEAAETALHGAFERFSALLPDDASDVVDCLAHHAMALQSVGRLEDAEAAWRCVLERRQLALGSGHPDVVMSLNNLALVKKARGRPVEAVLLLREAWDLCREAEAAGEAHDHGLLAVAGNLLSALRAAGRDDEAEALFAWAAARKLQVPNRSALLARHSGGPLPPHSCLEGQARPCLSWAPRGTGSGGDTAAAARVSPRSPVAGAATAAPWDGCGALKDQVGVCCFYCSPQSWAAGGIGRPEADGSTGALPSWDCGSPGPWDAATMGLPPPPPLWDASAAELQPPPPGDAATTDAASAKLAPMPPSWDAATTELARPLPPWMPPPWELQAPPPPWAPPAWEWSRSAPSQDCRDGMQTASTELPLSDRPSAASLLWEAADVAMPDSPLSLPLPARSGRRPRPWEARYASVPPCPADAVPPPLLCVVAPDLAHDQQASELVTPPHSPGSSRSPSLCSDEALPPLKALRDAAGTTAALTLRVEPASAAALLRELGAVAAALHKEAESDRFFRSALRCSMEAFGEDHPETLRIASAWDLVLRRFGRSPGSAA